MMRWKDFKLGTKIILGFSMVSLIALIIGIIGFMSLRNVSKSFDEVALVRLPAIENLFKMEYGFEKIRVAHRSLLIPGLSTEDRERQFRNIEEARKIYRESWAIYETLPHSELETKLWREFVAEIEKWRNSNEKFEAMLTGVFNRDIPNPYEYVIRINDFKNDHNVLEQQVMDAIRTGRHFEGGDDHTACRFGRWKHELQTTNSTIKRTLEDINDAHIEFHESVRQIRNQLAAGNVGAAQSTYINRMSPAAKLTLMNFEEIIGEATQCLDLFVQAEQLNLTETRVHQQRSLDLLNNIIEENERIADNEVEEGHAVANRANFSIIFVIIAGLIVAMLLGFAITRAIVTPVKKGVKFAQQIAEGNLQISLDVEQQDEIGQLAEALKMMVVKIKEVVISIFNGAENIAAASQQMSSASQQLSQGASEQASAAEEVSSSMEQMAANIQQNTDNSQQTEKISAEANEGILQVANRAKSAVEANKTILEKIKVVNDIAFQTNILALNAAVEAARAGEHGKGFAVVAAEVRKLAERSKVAAEEIVSLTQESYNMANSAGEVMMSTLPKVEKTTQLVQEITAASLEQNAGADQVNSAIQQLNMVTQQSAASSEELATSSEELAAQAQQLREVVSYFKIDSGDKKMTWKTKKTQNGDAKANIHGNGKAPAKKELTLQYHGEDHDDHFESF